MRNPSTLPLTLSLSPFHGERECTTEVWCFLRTRYTQGQKCLRRVRGPGLQIPVGRVPSRGVSFVVVYSWRAAGQSGEVTGRRRHRGDAVSRRQICRRAAFSR